MFAWLVSILIKKVNFVTVEFQNFSRNHYFPEVVSKTFLGNFFFQIETLGVFRMMRMLVINCELIEQTSSFTFSRKIHVHTAEFSSHGKEWMRSCKLSNNYIHLFLIS